MNGLKISFFAFSLLFLIIGCKKPNDNSNSTPLDEVISYGNHPLQTVQLLLPANHNANTKVVVMLHGGGWVMGYHPDETVTTFSGRYGWDIQNRLLNQGYACAIMKYRTACYKTVPDDFTGDVEANLNAMHEDISLCLQKLKSIASEYKISASHYQLLGESAGGHIVMSYAIRSDADPVVKSAVSMFGPVLIDDNDWQNYLESLGQGLVPKPNYFRQKAVSCNSVTEKMVRPIFSLKSFTDVHDIDMQGDNPEFNVLSPNRVENIQNDIPIFVMHGEVDALVPSYHADSMYVGLQAVHGTSCDENDFSCSFKKKIYPNCGHGWTGCSKVEILENIESWINNH